MYFNSLILYYILHVRFNFVTTYQVVKMKDYIISIHFAPSLDLTVESNTKTFILKYSRNFTVYSIHFLAMTLDSILQIRRNIKYPILGIFTFAYLENFNLILIGFIYLLHDLL